MKVKRRRKKLNDPLVKNKMLNNVNKVVNDISNSNTVGRQILSNAEFVRVDLKPIRLIVYINEFDKLDKDGNLKCRNIPCDNAVCKPYRKYCSKKCSQQFTKWYNSNFYWRNIRNQILRRDNFTCQLCGIQLNRRKRMNRDLKNWLECDHIIPKSFYKYLGYDFDTLENKIKTILEFVHNSNNLRTVCYKCHRKLTNNISKDRSSLIKLEE